MNRGWTNSRLLLCSDLNKRWGNRSASLVHILQQKTQSWVARPLELVYHTNHTLFLMQAPSTGKNLQNLVCTYTWWLAPFTQYFHNDCTMAGLKNTTELQPFDFLAKSQLLCSVHYSCVWYNVKELRISWIHKTFTIVWRRMQPLSLPYFILWAWGPETIESSRD